MSEEKKSNCCSKCNNCYAIIALCISFLAIGMLLGNWMGKCTKSKKGCDIKKCQSYSVDGKVGSTCSWSKKCEAGCEKACCIDKKTCAPGCEKACCIDKKTCAPGCEKACCIDKKTCAPGCEKACCNKTNSD